MYLTESVSYGYTHSLPPILCQYIKLADTISTFSEIKDLVLFLFKFLLKP